MVMMEKGGRKDGLVCWEMKVREVSLELGKERKVTLEKEEMTERE